jgi:hypothetical protein
MKFFVYMKGTINATIELEVSSVRDLFTCILSESVAVMTLPAVKFIERSSSSLWSPCTTS